MIVTTPLAPGRVAAPSDFSDIAPCSDVRWGPDGALRLTFDRDLTADETARVRVRCMSATSVEETLRMQALTALQANRDFLAVATPTAAQNAAQIRSLTRQMQAALRLATGRLDGTD